MIYYTGIGHNQDNRHTHEEFVCLMRKIFGDRKTRDYTASQWAKWAGAIEIFEDKSDYGIISISVPDGLTTQQKQDLLKRHLDNQLFTQNVFHKNEIYDTCLCMIDSSNVTLNWDRGGYKYSVIIGHLEGM